MTDDATPVAARSMTPSDAAFLGEIQSDANLHVQVGAATRRFHAWQQIPAWLLGFAAVGLGFLMVLRGYDSAAGWFAVSTAVVLSVIASYRSPFAIGETALSTAPGHRTKKKATTPPTNPPTGG
jgi:uncharacterized membrane protein